MVVPITAVVSDGRCSFLVEGKSRSLPATAVLKMWTVSHSEDGFNVQISKEPIKRAIQRIILFLGKVLTRKAPFQEKMCTPTS